ncbi:MAG: V-type ATP synthase subunit I [Nanobdellota archaeon]
MTSIVPKRNDKKVYRATILVPSGESSIVLDALQQSGIAHVDSSEDIVRFENTFAEISSLQDSLKKIEQLFSKQGLVLDSVSSKNSFSTSKDIIYSSHIKSTINRLLPIISNYSDKINTIEKKKHSLRKEIISLNNFPSLPLHFFLSTQQHRCTCALLPTEKIFELQEHSTERRIFFIEKSSRKQSFICEYTSGGFDSYLHSRSDVSLLTVPKTSLDPHQYRDSLSHSIAELDTRKSSLHQKLSSLFKKYNAILLDYKKSLSDAKSLLLASSSITPSSYLERISVWIAHPHLNRFKSVLNDTTSHFVLQSIEQEDAPTYLSNNSFAEPFEEITKLYSVPKYGRFDPTFLIALFFPLMFGIMYSDAVYGFIIATIALVMTFMPRKAPSKNTNHFSRILLTCGLTTMLFGLLFGSYFGNFFDTLGLSLPQAIDVMTDIIPLVILSLSIGLIHIAIGLVVGFMENIKQKKISSAFKDQGVWLLFIVSALPLFIIPPNVRIISFIGMALALFINAVFVFKEQGIISSILSLFDISKLTGDLASYIRIMALAIGTSGIALAVNVMVSIAIDNIPVGGIIVGGLIFIIGHVFNMLISGLGAFIHTLRLHFLEHFGKYYEGDGLEYTPLEKESSSRVVFDT